MPVVLWSLLTNPLFTQAVVGASLSSWDEDNDDGVDQDYKAGDDEEEVGDDDMASLSFWYEDSDVEEEEEGEYKAGDDDGDEWSDDDRPGWGLHVRHFFSHVLQVNEYKSRLPGHLLSRRFRPPPEKSINFNAL